MGTPKLLLVTLTGSKPPKSVEQFLAITIDDVSGLPSHGQKKVTKVPIVHEEVYRPFLETCKCKQVHCFNVPWHS